MNKRDSMVLIKLFLRALPHRLEIRLERQRRFLALDADDHGPLENHDEKNGVLVQVDFHERLLLLVSDLMPPALLKIFRLSPVPPRALVEDDLDLEPFRVPALIHLLPEAVRYRNILSKVDAEGIDCVAFP